MNFNYKLLLCYIMFITMILSSEKPSEEQDLEEALHEMIPIYQNNPNDPDVLKKLKAFATDRLIKTYVHDSDERNKLVGPFRNHLYYWFKISEDGSNVEIFRIINDECHTMQDLDSDTFLKFPVFTLKISSIEKFVCEWQFSNFEYDGEKKEFNIVKENDIEFHFYVEDLFPELPEQVKNLQVKNLHEQGRITNIHDITDQEQKVNDNQDITHDDSIYDTKDIELELDNKEQVKTKTKINASCCTVV